MTELQLKTDLANITDAELIEQAKNMICKLAETSGRSLQMSVPPNKRDTDMLLMELVNRYDNAVNNLLISGVVVPKGTLPKDIDFISKESWELFDKHYDNETSNKHTKHWNFMEGIKTALKNRK